MNKSSPGDLVVAFRSFPRRRAELLEVADGAPVGGYLALQRHFTEAGALLRVNGDPNAIANAIAATPADEFDIPTLDALREHTLEVGGLLRRIANAHGDVDD